MIKSYWHDAHQRVVAGLIKDLRPVGRLQYMICASVALAAAVATSMLIYYQVPLRYVMISVLLLVAALIIPVIYALRIFSYPAIRHSELVETIGGLKRRLDGIGATEGTLIRLSELLFWAKQLQTEDIRTDSHLDDWAERYQTIVQIIYSDLNSNISLSAATAFVAHPVLKPSYSRGCLNERHRTMRLLLDHYVIKLSSLIDGYYVHLSGHSHVEEQARQIAA